MIKTTAALLLSLASLAVSQEPTYRVVVGLKERGEQNAVARMAEIAASQRRVGRLMDGRNGRVTQVYATIQAFAAEVTREGWTALAADPGVTKVDLDQAAEVTMARVQTTTESLGVKRMGLTGTGVTVAVIDTGIDASHPDLAGAIIDEACFCMNAGGQPCCPNGSTKQLGMGSARDDNGHGTHLAGIIAGRGRVAPKGLAPGAYLVVIKIADKNGSTSTWSMLAALDWLAASRPGVQVVNMSLGTALTYKGSCDSASSITASLASVAHILKSRGTILVAAAGNSGLTEQMTAPACVSEFLSVGAVHTQAGRIDDSNGCTDVKTAEDRVACFSNSSSALSLLAPGAGIVSANLGGGKAVGSGTSQAAAVVSGVAALLIQGAPQGSGEKVDAALRGSGVMVTDRRNSRVTPRIDARAALTALGTL